MRPSWVTFRSGHLIHKSLFLPRLDFRMFKFHCTHLFLKKYIVDASKIYT